MLGKLICFIAGVMTGGTLGVIGMCIFNISGQAERWEEYRK